jgi:hypothetical protein
VFKQKSTAYTRMKISVHVLVCVPVCALRSRKTSVKRASSTGESKTQNKKKEKRRTAPFLQRVTTLAFIKVSAPGALLYPPFLLPLFFPPPHSGAGLYVNTRGIHQNTVLQLLVQIRAINNST